MNQTIDRLHDIKKNGYQIDFGNVFNLCDDDSLLYDSLRQTRGRSLCRNLGGNFSWLAKLY